MPNDKIKSMRGNEYPTEPWQVRCDRASVLGNPYGLTNLCLRDQSCDLYQKYFDDKVNNTVIDAMFMDKLMELKWLLDKYGKLELYCWCYPLRCHTETIKRYLEEIVKW